MLRRCWNTAFIPSSNLLGGQFRFDLNGVALRRGNGINQQRITSEMRWRLPLVIGGGQLWTFIADVRGDAYRLETPVATATLPPGSTTVTRAIPMVALDWRWPFIARRPGRTLLCLLAHRAAGGAASMAAIRRR